MSLAPWGIAGARAALQLTFYLMASCTISKGTQEHPSGVMSWVLCSLLPTRSVLWAVTQNPLLGACSAYKIPVFPPSLDNGHVVL